MVVRISDKTQNYSKVTKLLVKPTKNRTSLEINLGTKRIRKGVRAVPLIQFRL